MNEATKKYELRELSAQDIFAMSKIIKKIGIHNFKKCFSSEEIKEAIANLTDEQKKSGSGLVSVGMDVFFEIAGVIFDRLPECEAELYDFLATLSGFKVKELQKLSMADFLEMVVEVIKKPEFKDFFKVASRLFK